MSTDKDDQPKRTSLGSAARAARRRIAGLTPLLGVSGALLAILLVYLGYDYAAMRATPCEAIFRQTTLGLSARISFLKSEGEISIGREQLVELGERAQMAALNLKTCCTVLDAGRLNPEQFLQCKAKARAYDAKLEEISDVVERTAPPDAAGASMEAKASSEKAGEQPIPVAEAKSRIAETVDEARTISKDFNREVVEVRKTQALETLKLEAPKEVTVSAKESEPNNDSLNTNAVPLDTWISASIGESKDADVYAFETPATYRDWIVIELDNRSTTLEPRIQLFDTGKASLGFRHNTTPGANLDYRLVSEPATRYLVRISNYYGESLGGYLLRVRAEKAYDEYEPNDGNLTAKSIPADTEIEAAIMDGKDNDFFRIEAPEGATQMQVTLTNASTTLRPHVEIYGDDKIYLTHKYNTTAGADLAVPLAVSDGKAFRVRMKDYYSDAGGAYKLKVTYATE